MARRKNPRFSSYDDWHGERYKVRLDVKLQDFLDSLVD